MAQVHSEHTTDLFQGTCPLWLIPAGCLQEAIAVREAQVGVRARGRAGRAGGVRGRIGREECNIQPELKHTGHDGTRLVGSCAPDVSA